MIIINQNFAYIFIFGDTMNMCVWSFFCSNTLDQTENVGIVEEQMNDLERMNMLLAQGNQEEKGNPNIRTEIIMGGAPTTEHMTVLDSRYKKNQNTPIIIFYNFYSYTQNLHHTKKYLYWKFDKPCNQ